MKTKQAVAHVIKHKKLTKYAVAQMLGASPSSVDQWLRRTKMSKAYAEVFFIKFKIIVTDAC
jgi:predicted transcriptional regulator